MSDADMDAWTEGESRYICVLREYVRMSVCVV